MPLWWQSKPRYGANYTFEIDVLNNNNNDFHELQLY